MARIIKSFALIAVLVLAANALAGASPDYVQTIVKARVERVERLRQPDGYLALTASGWLEPGDNTVGSAADNRFRAPGAPAHLGVLHLDANGKVELRLADPHGITIDGRPAQQTTIPLHDEQPSPTRVGFGDSYLYVVENGTQRGLRVKNNQAPLRVHFPGFDYFPTDPSWRIEATWVPFEPAQHLRIAYVTGTEEDVTVPGKAVFRRDGQTYELRPIEEDGQLFFVFSDRTAGKLTYGGARFVYASAPVGGKLLLDFNLAMNPPCAITPHVVCPLAPPENRLRLAVTAGEKRFPEERYSSP